MSVWPNCGSPAVSLIGTEGELVSVKISVEPRLLERLLEALAGLEFPINPQIYHHGASPAIVEFPAWAARLEEVRESLRRRGLEAAAVSVRNMLEDLHISRATA
jgi:hypothetical protein